MRIAVSIAKSLAGLFALAMLAGLAWLWISPPDLIRLGSSYAAKIICSNAFLAGRDPNEVLTLDVQAPGHPLLKLMQAEVEEDEARVRAALLGVFGSGYAVFREGMGCASIPEEDFELAGQRAVNRPPGIANPSLWPVGDRVEPAPGAAVASVVNDPLLTGPGMRAVVIVRNGRIIAESYGPGFTHDMPLLGWSMTKAVNAAIAGTVAADGRLSVDDGNLFPAWSEDGRADITLGHLLGMESGLAFNEYYGGVTDVTRMLYLEPDMAAFAADKPLLHPPGMHFAYSSGSSILAARVWQNAIGDAEAALEWPYRMLFAPLGMDTAVLETDAHGTFAGSSYLYASARDWARFGLLLLREGVWQGRRILPEGWVEWMRTPTEASGGEYGRGIWLHGPRINEPPDSDPDAGFELPEDAYWLIGHDGQTMTIVPSLRLIVLRMGLTPTRLGYKPQALVEAVVKALDVSEGGGTVTGP
jgi:Beta-lactamase class C and other penicillin binding proteins